METGSKIDLVDTPPVYSFSPKTWPAERKKKLVVISIVVVVLSLIAVAAILIGVKMTQDHTEKIFQITHNEKGQETQETATINKQNGVASFSVTSPSGSATVVYDYTNKVIGLKNSSIPACYVTKMNIDKVPSLDSISKMYQSMQLQASSSGSNSTQNQQNTYYAAQNVEVADRSVLGTTINVLCSNYKIYWMQETSDRSMTRAFCLWVRICFFRCITLMKCF